MKNNNFYATQSIFTNPKEYEYLFSVLPKDIRLLRGIVQGLIIHNYDDKINEISFPEERLSEIDSRYVSIILRKLLRLANKPLSEIRTKNEKVIGSCRDFSLLLCSILRYQGVPARLRYGFTNYLYKGFNHDQAMMEYWNAEKNRWCLVDVRTSEQLITARNLKLDFDLCDVPRDRYIVAGKAWQLCRDEGANPNHFGAGLSNKFRGKHYIFEKLVQDLASLNKCEMLLWDYWGIMLNDHNSYYDEQLLNEIVAKVVSPDIDAAVAKAIYAQHPLWQVRDKVRSYTLYSKPYEINIFQKSEEEVYGL